MQTIFSKPHKHGDVCDRQYRRDFLTIGGSIADGLMLLDVLRAEAAQRRAMHHTANIHIHLAGR